MQLQRLTNWTKSKVSPEDAVDGGTSIDQVAAVSKMFKSNYTRIVKCQNCGTQHPAKQCQALGKKCFSCGKRNHFANLCRKPRQASLNTVLATLGKSSSKLCNKRYYKSCEIKWIVRYWR